MLERRTKIVATLGPATDAPGVLDRLVAAGMDCARLNCSHGDADALRRRAAEVRDAARRCGRPLGLLFDLQGPKLRLNGDTDEQVMQTGDTITFSEDGPGPGRVIVDFVGFSRLVTERSQVVIGDGVPRFAVEAIRPGEVDCRTISPGRLAPRKGINVTHARPELPAITEKDATDLELALDRAVELGAATIVVLGGVAGRFDHVVGGLLLLADERYAGIDVTARLGEARVTVVRGEVTLEGRVGDYVTLLPVGGPAEGVTTSGLVYPLDAEDLAPGTTRGVSNELAARTATVRVRHGVILAIQPSGR